MNPFLSQSEHEAINAREYPGTREICCVCSDPTGRAGRGEDSIYRIADQDFPLSPDGESCQVNKGDEIGPLCADCTERMIGFGLLREETMTDATGQQTEPQATRWLARDADGLTWVCENEPQDYNGRMWALGQGTVQWIWPELFNLKPGTKARLLLAPAVSATGASTSGLKTQGTASGLAGISL